MKLGISEQEQRAVQWLRRYLAACKKAEETLRAMGDALGVAGKALKPFQPISAGYVKKRGDRGANR